MTRAVSSFSSASAEPHGRRGGGSPRGDPSCQAAAVDPMMPHHHDTHKAAAGNSSNTTMAPRGGTSSSLSSPHPLLVDESHPALLCAAMDVLAPQFRSYNSHIEHQGGPNVVDSRTNEAAARTAAPTGEGGGSPFFCDDDDNKNNDPPPHSFPRASAASSLKQEEEEDRPSSSHEEEQQEPSSLHRESSGSFLSVRSPFEESVVVVKAADGGGEEEEALREAAPPLWESLTVPGRESESLRLRQALERCCAQGKDTVKEGEGGGGEMVLVTGASGTGKTHLVESALRAAALEAGGAFVSGKFDLLEGREQYYALVQAMAGYARNLEAMATPERLDQVRAAMAPHKDTAKILWELVPSLAQVLDLEHYGGDSGDAEGGEGAIAAGGTTTSSLSQLVARFVDAEEEAQSQAPPRSSASPAKGRKDSALPSSASLSSPAEAGATARERLQVGIRQFFSAVCTPDHPTVLFLDDLQWAEPASLDLLLSLFASRIPGLLVVGACRDNEVDPASYLCVVLRDMETMRVRINQIVVADLKVADLSQMLSETFRMPNAKAAALSDMLSARAKGNTFFSMKLLRYLAEEGFVYPTADGESWTFDSQKAVRNALDAAEDAVSLMVLVIEKQDSEVRDTLMVASCLGNEFSERVLGAAVTYTVAESLHAAERLGLLRRAGHGRGGAWTFAHDRIQESSYSLIPPHEREHVHLMIGRRLWAGLSETELDANVNVVVKQLRLGARLVEDPAEREQLATLLLRAGEMAAKSSAHATARQYIGLGIKLLGERHWRDQYELSLDLYNAAAEVEYCLANFARLDELTAEVLERARTRKDKVRALTTRIYGLGASRVNEATDLGLQTLRELFGEVIPRSPSKLSVVLELMKTKRLLRKHSDESVLSLPPMLDFYQLASLRIMCLLMSYAIMIRPLLAPLLAMRIIQQTLKHGLSGMSSAGFASYGMILSEFFQDVEGGIRYGKIAMRILDKFDAMELFPRVSTCFFAFSLPYKVSFRELLPQLRFAHRVGLGGGDIEHAMMSAGMYGSMAMFCDVSLAELSVDQSSFVSLTSVYGQRLLGDLFRPLAQLIQCLRGECDDPSDLNGTFLDWRVSLSGARRAKQPYAISSLLCCAIALASYFHKIEDAALISKELTLPGSGVETLPCFIKCLVWLHEGLTAVFPTSKRGRSRGIKLARRNLRHLKELSTHSEKNYRCKALLLSARISSALGRFALALPEYEESIMLAKRERMSSDVALACELRAQALQSLGRYDEARVSLEESIQYYELWGASAKVSQLRAQLVQPSRQEIGAHHSS